MQHTYPIAIPDLLSTIAERRGAALVFGRHVLVVSGEGVVGEALAIALSTCGFAARSVRPGNERHQDSTRPGVAVVLPGAGRPDCARLVAGLADAGHRVVMVGGNDQIVGPCVEAGAVAVVDGEASLSDLVEVVDGLARGEDPPARFGTSGFLERSREADARAAADLSRLATLTRREREILAALMAGHRASVIARDSYVSLHTVRSQIRSLLGKLRVNSQLEAVALARRADFAE
jgi:DNA-binding NarL/FixJ family response regulator